MNDSGKARIRHRPDQIVDKLALADLLLSQGVAVGAVYQELGISEATYHRWRNQFGGMKSESAQRISELKAENARLRRQLAGAELELTALRLIIESPSTRIRNHHMPRLGAIPGDAGPLRS